MIKWWKQQKTNTIKLGKKIKPKEQQQQEKKLEIKRVKEQRRRKKSARNE